MFPGKYDTQIYRGKTWSVSIGGKNAQGVVTNFGTEYDLIRMQIRPPWIKGFPKQAPLLELTQANGRIQLENEGTSIRLSISAADTATLEWNEGIYDLELVKAGDPEIVDGLLYGSINVIGEVTV